MVIKGRFWTHSPPTDTLDLQLRTEQFSLGRGGGDPKPKIADSSYTLGKKEKIHNEASRGWNKPPPRAGDPQSGGNSQPWALPWGVKNLNPTPCAWLLGGAPERPAPKVSSFERQRGFHPQDPPIRVMDSPIPGPTVEATVGKASRPYAKEPWHYRKALT